MRMNKRGEGTGEQVMGIWFIALVVISVVGLSLGVLIYFGSNYDFRQVEAGILNYKIRSCLLGNDFDWKSLENNPSDFYVRCGLSMKILNDSYSETRIAIEICKDNCDKVENRVFQLGSNFEACKFTGANVGDMKCSDGNVNTGIAGKYEVVVGSNHQAVKGALQ